VLVVLVGAGVLFVSEVVRIEGLGVVFRARQRSRRRTGRDAGASVSDASWAVLSGWSAHGPVVEEEEVVVARPSGYPKATACSSVAGSR
jgi:hypothetical protein